MAQIQSGTSGFDDEADEGAPAPAPAPQANTDAVDSLLDEIDATLETNAEQFVRSFVQKGGQ